MLKAPIPNNEQARLNTLREYKILDTFQEKQLDEITEAAALISDCKISLISLVDEKRQWFKSKKGLIATETPRDVSFCGHAIMSDDIFVIEDAKLDERFSDNPLVTGDPNVRFYAGAPLIAPNGHRIGTLCVIDKKPSALTNKQKQTLKMLAKQIISIFEIKKYLIEKAKKDLELKSYKKGLDSYAIIARTDKDGLITFVNEKFCEITGYSKDETTGKSLQLISSGYHEEDFFDKMWSFVSKGDVWRGEVKNKAKEGSYYWVDQTVTPIKDQSGQVLEYMFFEYDITAKKQNEILLEETQKNAKIGGWELDVETLETKWTDETYRIHELEIGTPTNSENGINFFAEHERARIADCVQKCIEEGVPFDSDFELITAKGNKIWAHSKGIPEKDNQGNVVRVIGTFQDITEYKIKEQKLKKQKAISQHNAKLASIGELAAGVGHEINNPLAIIKGYLTVVAKKSRKNSLDSDELISYIDKINTATDRISKIVHGLRTFARTDSNETSEFSILEATAESFNMVKEIYEKDGIKVKLSCPKLNNSFIKANRGKFQQVLMNLISNAKDATLDIENRKIDINLSEDDKNLILVVKDNGCGVPKSIRSKIFDPFFTTKGVNKGTGIGLSLSQSFIEEMNGSLSIESAEGQGTSFIIKIPQYIKSDKSELSEKQSQKKEPSTQSQEEAFEIKKKKAA